MHAGAFQCGDDAIEFRHVGHRAYAHSIHLAAGDDIVAHENLAVLAAAQFGRQALGIGGVGEGAGLNEEWRTSGSDGCGSAGGSGTVSVIDPHTNAIIATVKVGERPWNMALTHDGAKLYVANGRTNNVSVIDTSTNQVVHTIGVGERPWGVAIH